jgi:hypothetical protein
MGPASQKFFMDVINLIAKKASVIVEDSQKRLSITKALGYYTSEFIKDVKSFMIQAPVA